MTSIRCATPQDTSQAAALLAAAFGDDVTSRLVEELLGAPGYVPDLAFVAEDGGRVVGYVLMSYVDLELADRRRRKILCLSPLAVLPEAQERGTGGALVERALAAADERGEPFVVLEGSPAYYRRFGFVPAAELGLRRPSQRIPRAAFQVRPLSAHDPAATGRVLYPPVFWDLGLVGLRSDGVAWLDEFERYARGIEDALAGSDGAKAFEVEVRDCPGWLVGDVVRHLGVVHRIAAAWMREGRRPRVTPALPDGGDVLAWFADGWRALHDFLDGVPEDAPAATWSPWDATAGFWLRRQTHEIAIHAADIARSLGTGWSVSDGVALDGIEEVVRLWLGTRLAADAGGSGALVRLVAADRLWTIGLHGHIAEVHDLPTDPDAVVSAPPGALYAWLWGRAEEESVQLTGDLDAVTALRAALKRVM